MNLSRILNYEFIKRPAEDPHGTPEGPEAVRERLRFRQLCDTVEYSSRCLLVTSLVPVSVLETALLCDTSLLGWAWTLALILTIWSVLAASAFFLLWPRRRLRVRFISPPENPSHAQIRYWQKWGIIARYPILLFMCPLGIMPLIAGVTTHESFLEGIRSTWICFVFAAWPIAGACLSRGLLEREGDSVCCAHCRYPVPESSLDDLGVCTECGRDLSKPDAMCMGDLVRRPLPLAIWLLITSASSLLCVIAA